MPHTPENPPVYTLQSSRQPKQKLSLGLDAVKLEPSPENDYTDLSSNLAFTPLETPTLGGLADREDYLFDLPQRLNALKMGATFSPAGQNNGQSVTSSPAGGTSRRPSLAIPRRLSYRLNTPLSPSPLSITASRGFPSPETAALASPLDLQNQFIHTKTSGFPDTPTLKPSCSPLIASGSPLGYFSLQA